MPISVLLRTQASDWLSPQGTLSILSVRSTSMVPASGSTSMVTLMGMPSGSSGGIGSCVPEAVTCARPSLPIAPAMRRSE